MYMKQCIALIMKFKQKVQSINYNNYNIPRVYLTPSLISRRVFEINLICLSIYECLKKVYFLFFPLRIKNFLRV